MLWHSKKKENRFKVIDEAIHYEKYWVVLLVSWVVLVVAVFALGGFFYYEISVPVTVDTATSTKQILSRQEFDETIQKVKTERADFDILKNSSTNVPDPSR